jgi:hypothetical protein
VDEGLLEERQVLERDAQANFERSALGHRDPPRLLYVKSGRHMYSARRRAGWRIEQAVSVACGFRTNPKQAMGEGCD